MSPVECADSGMQPQALICATSNVPAAPDTCYLLGRHGFIYCGRRVGRDYTVRQLGVILISVDDASFTVCLRRQPDLVAAAAAVAPLVSRRMVLGDAAVIRFNVCPSHPAYPALSGLRGAGVMALERSAYSRHDTQFARLRDGLATLDEAEQLFQYVVCHASAELPHTNLAAGQAKEMMALLDARPEMPLDELAQRCGKSSSRVSRHFRAVVGMSVRDYKEFARGQRLLDLMYSDRALTEVALEAGYRDSSQLSHTFQRWFGCSPSLLRNPKFVRVIRR